MATYDAKYLPSPSPSTSSERQAPSLKREVSGDFAKKVTKKAKVEPNVPNVTTRKADRKLQEALAHLKFTNATTRK